MNKKTLLELLKGFKDDDLIWIRDDAEVNDYSPIISGQVMTLIENEDGADLIDESWNPKSFGMTVKQWNDVIKNSPKVLLLSTFQENEH